VQWDMNEDYHPRISRSAGSLFKQIGTYLERDLTNEADVFDAFRGIRMQCNPLESAPHLFLGLPITPLLTRCATEYSSKGDVGLKEEGLELLQFEWD
jgi:hypothetical protein